MTSRKRLKRKKPSQKRKPLPGLLILIGLILFVGSIFFLKNGLKNETQDSQTLEGQLDAALQEKRPTFVFLHSLECIPCKEMMEIVAQVYPPFEDTVVLIDVDVYDQRNTNILRREGLQAIPTLVFYDREGERQMHIGVLPPEQLGTVLDSLTQGN